MKLSIAVVQFKITHLNPNRNFERIEQFIKKATDNSANVIIFPEDCITGSIFGDRNKLDTTSKYQKRFQVLAKKYKIDIVTGSYMEGSRQGNFNTSYYIDSKGKVLGKYQKNNLYLSERYFLSPGTEIAVFNTRYGKAGIIICWDILFPELFRRMVRAGVQIIYCPSYWYKEIAGDGLVINKNTEENTIDALCVARATENTIAFVYSNAAGRTNYSTGEQDTLIGHSQITTPFAGTLKKLNHNREDMFIQEIDLSILDKANKIYQIRNDLRKRII